MDLPRRSPTSTSTARRSDRTGQVAPKRTAHAKTSCGGANCGQHKTREDTEAHVSGELALGKLLGLLAEVVELALLGPIQERPPLRGGVGKHRTLRILRVTNGNHAVQRRYFDAGPVTDAALRLAPGEIADSLGRSETLCSSSPIVSLGLYCSWTEIRARSLSAFSASNSPAFTQLVRVPLAHFCHQTRLSPAGLKDMAQTARIPAYTSGRPAAAPGRSGRPNPQHTPLQAQERGEVQHDERAVQGRVRAQRCRGGPER